MPPIPVHEPCHTKAKPKAAAQELAPPPSPSPGGLVSSGGAKSKKMSI